MSFLLSFLRTSVPLYLLLLLCLICYPSALLLSDLDISITQPSSSCLHYLLRATRPFLYPHYIPPTFFNAVSPLILPPSPLQFSTLLLLLLVYIKNTPTLLDSLSLLITHYLLPIPFIFHLHLHLHLLPSPKQASKQTKLVGAMQPYDYIAVSMSRFPPLLLFNRLHAAHPPYLRTKPSSSPYSYLLFRHPPAHRLINNRSMFLSSRKWLI